MIRTVLKAETKNITLELPDEYLGKNLEIFVFALDETFNSVEENTITHFASQKILAQDWLTPEEDDAWKTL